MALLARVSGFLNEFVLFSRSFEFPSPFCEKPGCFFLYDSEWVSQGRAFLEDARDDVIDCRRGLIEL